MTIELDSRRSLPSDFFIGDGIDLLGADLKVCTTQTQINVVPDFSSAKMAMTFVQDEKRGAGKIVNTITAGGFQ